MLKCWSSLKEEKRKSHIHLSCSNLLLNDQLPLKVSDFLTCHIFHWRLICLFTKCMNFLVEKIIKSKMEVKQVKSFFVLSPLFWVLTRKWMCLRIYWPCIWKAVCYCPIDFLIKCWEQLSAAEECWGPCTLACTIFISHMILVSWLMPMIKFKWSQLQ